MTTTRILVFAKAPVAGEVKTRLIPAIGAQAAAALAAEMLARTAEESLAAGIGPIELCADPDPASPKWSGQLPKIDTSAQGDGDLGQRLARAAKRVIENGERVLLIGTDCPALDRRRLRDAAAKLDHHDAVLHPALDGGYALLGLARFDPSLFDRIGWGGAGVAGATLDRIGALGWRVHVGATLQDVDEPGDLAGWPFPRFSMLSAAARRPE